MIQISSKLPSGDTTIFTEMSALAQQYQAINLGQGFPDFDPPTDLIRCVQETTAMHHHQYAPMAGDTSLRTIISQKIESLYGNGFDPISEITITAGATQALFTAITAFIRSGDEVIIFEPAYDSYRPSIILAGGITVPYTLYAPDFKIDWDNLKRLITDKTKMIIINTPNNPTATVFNAQDWKKLDEILTGTQIIVLSDEVYEHLIFDGSPHESVLKYPHLRDRSMAVFSFGKTFHCTGWKIGYCVGSEYLMDEFRKVHQWNVFSVNSILQKALATYMTDPESYQNIAKFYEFKRDYFRQILADTLFKPLDVKGTFFQICDYSAYSDMDDRSFAKNMVINHGVAAIPLSPFYNHEYGGNLIRFCFAKSTELLDQAAKKLRNIH
jgi:methionine aminotransferase